MNIFSHKKIFNKENSTNKIDIKFSVRVLRIQIVKFTSHRELYKFKTYENTTLYEYVLREN